MEIEQGLEGIRECGAVIQSCRTNRATGSEPLCRVLRQVPEVTPGTRGVENNLGVIGKVELSGELVSNHLAT